MINDPINLKTDFELSNNIWRESQYENLSYDLHIY